MTEIEILSKTLETVGIAGFIVISSAVLIYKAMGIYSKRAEQMTLIESKTLDNARAERETTYKAQSELTSAVKYLADKTESVGKSQEETTRILATLKSENLNAIDATKQAEINVTSKLDTQHSILTAHTDGITTITTKLDELIALFVEYTKKHSQELEATINTKAREMVSLLQVQMNELQNQLVKERLKAYEDFNERFRDIPTVHFPSANPDAPIGASSGNGHAPDGATDA